MFRGVGSDVSSRGVFSDKKQRRMIIEFTSCSDFITFVYLSLRLSNEIAITIIFNFTHILLILKSSFKTTITVVLSNI